MLKDRYFFVWHDDFLKYLSESEKSKLKFCKANKKEVIYAEKIKFIIFTSGKARLKYYSKTNEYILGFVRPGNFIVLDEQTGLDITEKSEFYELSFKLLQSLCSNEKFAVSVINTLTRNLLSQREMTYDYTFLNIEERVTKLFLDTFTYDKPKDNVIKTCDITTMSQLLGASRQNVSKAINQFIKQGLITKANRNHYDISGLLEKNKI